MSMLATGSSQGTKFKGDVIPKGYDAGQMAQFTPEQMNLFKRMFGLIGPESYTARLAAGDEGMFNQMETPAKRQFQAQIGQLGSRYSGMGTGARHSSGFNLAGTQASSDFSQQLAGNRQNLQRQALMDMMGISESLLNQRPYERFLTKKQMPWWQQYLLQLNQGSRDLAKSAISAYTGGRDGRGADRGAGGVT